MDKSGIQIVEFVKKYSNGQCPVDNISLSVPLRHIVGFLGPNGAGKTTTIKSLLGFHNPTSGEIWINGVSPTEPKARMQLGYLPENAYYYEYLSALEALTFYGNLCGMRGKELRRKAEATLERVGLAGTGKKLLRHFSKGMRQRLGLAQAILHDPEILVLDEPMTGLDPLGRRQIRELLADLREAGKTIFFSSHELSEAELVCDSIAIIDKGKLLWHGNIKSLAGDGTVNLERVFLDALAGDLPAS